MSALAHKAGEFVFCSVVKEVETNGHKHSVKVVRPNSDGEVTNVYQAHEVTAEALYMLQGPGKYIVRCADKGSPPSVLAHLDIGPRASLAAPTPAAPEQTPEELAVATMPPAVQMFLMGQKSGMDMVKGMFESAAGFVSTSAQAQLENQQKTFDNTMALVGRSHESEIVAKNRQIADKDVQWATVLKERESVSKHKRDLEVERVKNEGKAEENKVVQTLADGAANLVNAAAPHLAAVVEKKVS